MGASYEGKRIFQYGEAAAQGLDALLAQAGVSNPLHRLGLGSSDVTAVLHFTASDGRVTDIFVSTEPKPKNPSAAYFPMR